MTLGDGRYLRNIRQFFVVFHFFGANRVQPSRQLLDPLYHTKHCARKIWRIPTRLWHVLLVLLFSKECRAGHYRLDARI